MKRFFSVCITIICLSIFWLTSCQNPVAGEEVEKASETEQSGVKDSEKTSETEQIYLNNSEIIWKGDLESAPENPEKNWIYYNTTDCNTYIWNAETKVWDILASEDWWQRGFINCNANEHGLSIGFNTWLMGRNGDNNNCTLYVTDNINGFQMIKSFSCNNQSWIGFNYPLTKKGEEYDVTIIVEGTIELRIQDRFKGIAQGGIGYPILKKDRKSVV